MWYQSSPRGIFDRLYFRLLIERNLRVRLLLIAIETRLRRLPVLIRAITSKITPQTLNGTNLQAKIRTRQFYDIVFPTILHLLRSRVPEAIPGLISRGGVINRVAARYSHCSFSAKYAAMVDLESS